MFETRCKPGGKNNYSCGVKSRCKKPTFRRSPLETILKLSSSIPVKPASSSRRKYHAWKRDESNKLKQLVEEQYGIAALTSLDIPWRDIAKHLPGRTSKQCRDRWNNVLRPDINHGGWNEQEDVVLCWQHSLLGPKWAAIAAYLPGRTSIAIKNRWHSHARFREDNSPSILWTYVCNLKLKFPRNEAFARMVASCAIGALLAHVQQNVAQGCGQPRSTSTPPQCVVGTLSENSSINNSSNTQCELGQSRRTAASADSLSCRPSIYCGLATMQSSLSDDPSSPFLGSQMLLSADGAYMLRTYLQDPASQMLINQNGSNPLASTSQPIHLTGTASGMQGLLQNGHQENSDSVRHPCTHSQFLLGRSLCKDDIIQQAFFKFSMDDDASLTPATCMELMAAEEKLQEATWAQHVQDVAIAELFPIANIWHRIPGLAQQVDGSFVFPQPAMTVYPSAPVAGFMQELLGPNSTAPGCLSHPCTHLGPWAS